MKKFLVAMALMLVALPVKAEEVNLDCNAEMFSSRKWDSDVQEFVSKTVPSKGSVRVVINSKEMYAKLVGYVRTKDITPLTASVEGHAIFVEEDDFGNPTIWLFAQLKDGLYLLQYKNTKLYSHAVLYKCN